MRQTILDLLNAGAVIVGDGGYQSELERRGYVTAGLNTPEVTIEHPEAVEQLHREFARSGADVLQAFTFAGSDDKTSKRVGIKGDGINKGACDIAKKVAKETGCLWAGGLSHTLIYRDGASKEEVQKLFKRQVDIFVEKESDFLIAEYFEFCEEAEWAVELLKKTGKPVAATMCINSISDAKGVPTNDCAVRLVKAGADIVGINCVFDPSESIKAVERMKEGLKKVGLKAHLMIQPLGYHCKDGGERGYMNLPEFPFALESRTLTRWDVHKITRCAYDIGVRYIGGCCGYMPYHIRAVAEELSKERGKTPESSEKHRPFNDCFFTGDTSGIKRDREFWMNLKPSSEHNVFSR